MTDLRIDVLIDGEPYSQQQLARLQYERTLHGLHELKRLGAKVTEGGHELSHSDLNWLEPERLEAVSIATRLRLGESGMVELLRDVLEDSDERWKKYNEDYIPGQVLTGQTDMTVTGLMPQEVAAELAGGDPARGLPLNPEHYAVAGDLAIGQLIMETFGMFGEPTFTHGVGHAEVPADFPFKKDPSYPIALFGELLLKSDETPIHVGAFHQFKPTTEGFMVRSIFFCPHGAPKAIAEGHKLHFAIELSNAMKAAYARKTGRTRA